MKSDAKHEAKPGISHNSWDKKKTKLDIAQISANDKLGMGDVALREQDTVSLKGSHAMQGVYLEKENAE